MATSFFSRWSKRKLEESTTEQVEAEVLTARDSTEVGVPQAQPTDETDAQQAETTVAPTESTTSEPTEPEEMSVAQLLVSEASESVKKAALRKMFLSEEFNIRDGLDDYDDDYSNLKSLSEGVAETLRNWVKEETEDETVEEPVKENAQDTESKQENDIEAVEPELSESEVTLEDEKELYIKTASDKNGISETKFNREEMGQNIPHKE